MAKEYVMPKLAMAMNEGTINQWLVAHGEKVEAGDPLVTIETEKVSYDCESPETGYLCIVGQEGDVVPCDQLIGYICESAEEAQALSSSEDSTEPHSETDKAPVASAPAEVPTQPVSGERIKASPLAKKIARDNQLELANVNGSGPGGRIVKRDVESALAHPQSVLTRSTSGAQERTLIPITGMRKTIADRMQQSLAETAQLSSSWETDITEMLAARKKLLDKQDALGTRVSVNAFIIKAICYAIKQVPIANACREGDDIVIYDNVNMGIAIAMPGTTEFDSGLMVGVLHNVESMGLADIDKQMKSLIERVRDGNAGPDDLKGSTITLSSTAGIAPPGMTTTPVLNQPNAALVGPSTPVERPVVVDGDIKVRTMMPVSFTFDHCLLDGEPAARFMKALHEALESPELLLA